MLTHELNERTVAQVRDLVRRNRTASRLHWELSELATAPLVARQLRMRSCECKAQAEELRRVLPRQAEPDAGHTSSGRLQSVAAQVRLRDDQVAAILQEAEHAERRLKERYQETMRENHRRAVFPILRRHYARAKGAEHELHEQLERRS